jgi:hypothetical protein
MAALLFVNKIEVDTITDAEMRSANTPWAMATGTNMRLWIQVANNPAFYQVPPDADLVGDPATGGLVEITILLDIDKASKYVQEGLLPLSVMRAWGMDPTDSFSYKEPKKALTEEEIDALSIESTYGFGILTEAQSIEVAKNIKIPQGFELPLSGVAWEAKKRVLEVKKFTNQIISSISKEQLQIGFNTAKSASEGITMTVIGLPLRANPMQTLQELYLETPSGGQITLQMLMDAYTAATVKPDQAVAPYIDEMTGLEVGKMVKGPKMGASTKPGPVAQAGIDLAAVDMAKRLKNFADEEAGRQAAALAQALMDVRLDPFAAREV